MKFLTAATSLFFLTHNLEVHANDNLRVRRFEESKAAAVPSEGAVILEVTLNDPPVSSKDSRSFNNNTTPFKDITAHIYKESAAAHEEEDNGKGFNPNTLPLRTRPEKASGGESSTRNVHGADDRYVFQDTSFPYSTVGKVQTATGSCTGTMVGRNLMLTANHCIKSGLQWMKFTPSYYDGSEPYGSAYALSYLRWFAKGDESSSSSTSLERAFDYALVVLDRNIGDDVGYMGSTTYNSQWNGEDYWDHIGYPGDVASGQRPIFVNNDAIQEIATHSYGDQSGYYMRTFLDTGGGQSGGPLYGDFNGDFKIVGVVSGGGSDNNVFGGGPALGKLIEWGRQQ
jgi:V8-like Glu-specific endopeptidase